MENHSPIIKFGITAGGKRSPFWRVRAGMKQPELFLEREAQGKQWHFSLHASGQWHTKEGGQKRLIWSRPNEVVPGYTRAVGVVLPTALAHHDELAPHDAVLVPAASDSHPTSFSIFYERPGANLASWPGKNADGTTFVGRIPMAADTGTCCIIALQEPLQPGRFDTPWPEVDELRKMRALAAKGNLAMTVVGELADGAIGLLDLSADPGIVAQLDEAIRRSVG